MRLLFAVFACKCTDACGSHWAAAVKAFELLRRAAKANSTHSAAVGTRHKVRAHSSICDTLSRARLHLAALLNPKEGWYNRHKTRIAPSHATGAPIRGEHVASTELSYAPPPTLYGSTLTRNRQATSRGRYKRSTSTWRRRKSIRTRLAGGHCGLKQR